MKKRTITFIIIVAAIIMMLAALGVMMKRVPAAIYQPRETDPEAQWGTITGSLGYPSEGIPPMGVCAETIDQKELYCTYAMLTGSAYTYGQGYELKAPSGTYRVFAHLVTETNAKVGYTDEYKAYYSQYVFCGMGIECVDHSPITITVKAREHTSVVDPVDWNNQ